MPRQCLVTAIKQECLKMSFKTMFRIAQHDFCRQVFKFRKVVWRQTRGEVVVLIPTSSAVYLRIQQ